MMIPVGIRIGAGGSRRAGYSRIIETAERFDVLGQRAEDLTVPLTRIGQDLHTQISAAFATEGATGASGKWVQLSPAYGQWKQKHAPGTPTLVGLRPAGPKGQRPQSYAPDGTMRRQLLMPLSDRSTWHITPKRLLYVPRSNIAGFHESGTPKMPARPPVDVSLNFLHSVDRTFVVWMNELLAGSGL